MKTTEKQVGLVLGVPTLGRPVPIQYVFAFASMHPPINFNLQSASVWGQEVADARNQLAQQALEADARYLFFLGDDVEPPGHSLKQLIFRMEHDPGLGVVGGIYCSKSIPPAPLVFRGNGAGSYWDWKLGEYFQVTGIGMDCTLIRTDVFRELEPPWFETIRKDGSLDGESSIESWTEDLWFCNRITSETQWKIYADSMVMCKHWQYLGGTRWQPHTMRTDSKPYLVPSVTAKGPRILDLGCGPHHWDFKGEGHVVRCDIRDECDPDYRIDLRSLPFDNDEFDIVFSSHTLEHFAREEIDPLLAEWVRCLKPGGELRLIIPNLAWAADRITKGVVDNDVLNVLYGSQEYAENFHKVGFTPDSLKKACSRQGVTVKSTKIHGYNIVLSGLKRKARKKKTDG